MAKLKNGTPDDNLVLDLSILIDASKVESRQGLDTRTIQNKQLARKKEKSILIDKLVRYITKRDHKVFDHAYNLNRKNKK